MNKHLLALVHAADAAVRCEFSVDSYGTILDGIAEGFLEWEPTSNTKVRVAGQNLGFATTKKGRSVFASC